MGGEQFRGDDHNLIRYTVPLPPKLQLDCLKCSYLLLSGFRTRAKRSGGHLQYLPLSGVFSGVSFREHSASTRPGLWARHAGLALAAPGSMSEAAAVIRNQSRPIVTGVSQRVDGGLKG